MIVQKRDFRKRKGRNVFFLLQAIPILILFMLVFFVIANRNINNSPNSIVERYGGMTGKVIDSLSLSSAIYNSSDLLDGTFTIAFASGDFLPLDTNFSFKIASQYPIYYVCEDGTAYEWKDINGSYVDPSPLDLCGDAEEIHYNCTDNNYGKRCCAYGVNGAILGNLDCSTGSVCGEECISLVVKTLQTLISESTTPDRGNFTTAAYRNNSQQIPWVTSGPGVGWCFNTSGGSLPPPTPLPQTLATCIDGDGNNGENSSLVKTDCQDWTSNYSAYGDDVCSNNSYVIERYCGDFHILDDCALCTNVQCKYTGSSEEGWYADCPKERLIMSGKCSVLDPGKYAPVCVPVEDSYWRSDASYCKPKIIPCNSSCSDGRCLIFGIDTCSGWTSNAYSIPFDNVGIRAPSQTGRYNMEVSGSVNTTVLTNYITSFVVNAFHRACVNKTCVYIEGPGTSDCDNDDDCNCEPDWTYGPWSDCINGQMQRTKVDLSNCMDPRTETQPCQNCTSTWFCAWQQCSSGTVQQKICSDAQRCDSSNVSYVSDSRVCCVENWKKTWGSCANGVKAANYQDLNNCGTEFLKPAAETRDCGFLPDVFTKWYTWVIVVLILAMVFLILLFTVFKKPKLGYEPRTYSSSLGNNNVGREASALGPSYSSAASKTSSTASLGAMNVYGGAKEVKTETKTRTKRATKKTELSEQAGARAVAATAKESEQPAEYPTELITYIREAMAAGATKDEIKAKLLEVGWDEKTVNDILSSL